MAKQKFTMPDGEIIEKDMPAFKTPYNHDTNFESDRTGTFCADPSLTKQEFKDETDINVILERFTRTGEPPPVTLPEHFTDASNELTWFDMQQRLADASATFYELPANIREQSLNDPARWADKVTIAMRKGNFDSLDELGIDTQGMRQDVANATRKAEEAKSAATPAGGATPAPTGSQSASGAPTGAK